MAMEDLQARLYGSQDAVLPKSLTADIDQTLQQQPSCCRKMGLTPT